VPIYRQIYESIAGAIRSGALCDSFRLPPTRELAGQLGLNRTTISAAYQLLEEDGLLHGEVGRGTFVRYHRPARKPMETISFSTSRPAQEEFPLSDFGLSCQEVLSSHSAGDILQLGSPLGYPPLREYLLEQARKDGSAGPDDDVLVTSGCQQAIDLIQRVLVRDGVPVLMEDPVYHGLKTVFLRGGCSVVGVPVGEAGLDVDLLPAIARQSAAKFLIVTPNFQNPTGTTLPLAARQSIVETAEIAGLSVVENDIYSSLRYFGEPLPTLRSLSRQSSALLLGSFSKVAFPGLRVGWIIANRKTIARLAESRQWWDLHTDQLSQAVLYRFAESGRLATHLSKVRRLGMERVAAAAKACERYLPSGSSFTQPEGGMNLWVRLPGALNTAELRTQAEKEGVSYLAGDYFAVSHSTANCLRLSFGSLTPDEITDGISRLGRLFRQEVDRLQHQNNFELSPGLV
jgi:2-aminoadipate transaminase